MAYFEYEPIESNGTLLKRIRGFLNSINEFPLVSSGLPEQIPAKMVWVIMDGGSDVSVGYQRILVRVKVIASSWSDAELLALKVRSYIESEDILVHPIYRVDDVSRPTRSSELEVKEAKMYIFNFNLYQLANNL